MRRQQQAEFGQALKGVIQAWTQCLKDLGQVSDWACSPDGRAPERATEHHARTGFIDPLLRALNWRAPALQTEAGLPDQTARSGSPKVRATTLRLDYLGLERTSDDFTPLLLVEAKHPQIELPTLKTDRRRGVTPSEVIATGIEGASLVPSNWNDWLTKLREKYLSALQRNTGAIPYRVCLANGKWIVVFTDVPGLLWGTCRDASIHVYADHEDMKRGNQALWGDLEYWSLSQQTPPLGPVEFARYCQADPPTHMSCGLDLLHTSHPTFSVETPAPVIHVRPIVFARLEGGTELVARLGQRDDATGTRLRNESMDGLRTHVDAVADRAKSLTGRVESAGQHFTPSNVQELSDAGIAFVRKLEATSDITYTLLTGDHYHCLLPATDYEKCPFHCYEEAVRKAAASTCGRADTPSWSSPRSYFGDGHPCHCAHADITDQKAPTPSPLVPNGPGGGIREPDPPPNCHILGFESRLCCRRCVYFEVCGSNLKMHFCECQRDQ